MVSAPKPKEGVITTGNPEIDKKLGGGIPVGSLTLIEGQSDSGKSVLAQQFIWGSVRDGYQVSVMTTENTVKSLLRQMQSLSLDVLDYCLLGKLKVYPVRAMRATKGVDRSLEALLTALTRLQDQHLVVIDSITSFIAHSTVEQTIAFFEDCKSYCNKGMTIITVAHPYAFNESTLVRISSMCDAHIHLGTENVGEKLLKIMEVSKVRGAQKSTGNVVAFEVEPGWGMRIIPFTKAKA